jgi:hypothetical protein
LSKEAVSILKGVWLFCLIIYCSDDLTQLHLYDYSLWRKILRGDWVAWRVKEPNRPFESTRSSKKLIGKRWSREKLSHPSDPKSWVISPTNNLVTFISLVFFIIFIQKNRRDALNFDSEFTKEDPILTPINHDVVRAINQDEFRGFSFVNPDYTPNRQTVAWRNNKSLSTHTPTHQIAQQQQQQISITKKKNKLAQVNPSSSLSLSIFCFIVHLHTVVSRNSPPNLPTAPFLIS